VKDVSRLLDTGLEQLTTVLLKMGDVAQKTVDLAIEGFLKRTDVSGQVRELSEMLLMMTVSVEEKAFELIVKYQPVASDLRIINSYMKIAYDFERLGRYAWDIAVTQFKFPSGNGHNASFDFLAVMAEKVMFMVHTSVKALRDNNDEVAKSLADTETDVDKLYSNCLDQLASTDLAAKDTISTVLVVRYLERIADHATYIGESIYYIATGQKIMLR
jgi:phosphate transport system protein